VATSWIPIAVGLYAFGVGIWKAQPGLFWATGLIFLLTLAIAYFQRGYRISYSDVAVIQEASGTKRLSIAFSEIHRIALERASALQMIQGSRPFRRVAIYSGHGAHARHIDVSLRHFAGEDIRALLESLHKQRPDLKVPRLDGHYWFPS
jgi:hypothetical protein